jgi:hypothetical protein
LQYPSEINGDNLNNVRREASRHLRNKKKEYLKDKINELAKNSKNKNIRDLYRGINEFTHCTGIWVEPGKVWMLWRKANLYQESNPSRTVCSLLTAIQHLDCSLKY